MVRTKRQHYVPRLHLRYLAGENPAGMVWTYDMIEGTWRPSTPENTAVESNIYSVKDQDGNHVDALEEWLTGIESKAAPIYRRMIGGDLPLGQDRADFAVFVSSLYARSPSILRAFAEGLGMASQATIQS